MMQFAKNDRKMEQKYKKKKVCQLNLTMFEKKTHIVEKPH